MTLHFEGIFVVLPENRGKGCSLLLAFGQDFSSVFRDLSEFSPLPTPQDGRSRESPSSRITLVSDALSAGEPRTETMFTLLYIQFMYTTAVD